MTPDTQLPDWLTRCAGNFPQRLAIKCGDVQWTFAAMERQVTRLARQLATLGVQHGSRVALLAANGLPYVACVHALARLGAILVPLNTRLTSDELRWQLEDVHATFLLSDRQHEARAHEIGPLSSGTLVVEGDTVFLPGIAESSQPLRTLIDLDATQAILYTSGTTGNPKGVLITYGMQWWNALGSALNLGHQPDDCWLACMPLFHIGGLSILMRSVIYGISVLLQERFDPVAVNKAIHEDRVSIISVVAAMLQRMLADLAMRDSEYPIELRCVLLGGGPAPQPLLEECARRNIPVVQTYGLTEACSQAVTLAPADALRKLGSAGRPLLPVQLRVLHDDREALPGEPGTIYLKGPTITPGYINRPQATRDALRDGWLSTGDIGYLDGDGYLYILDRRNDLIISGGENIYPAEIEAVFLSHPDVEEAGVSGRTDPQWGQVPVAFIHLRPGSSATAATLLDYAATRLARYKLPHVIHLVAALPRNSAGKLLRRELHTLLP